ncbi:glycosyltransferase family 4 protein, partial [Candidatus Peregrinibacteria bacterium]|nr:glycosyltransferase family 4 protein [Candidatus Peregrinibacteria bacterium]
MKQKLVILTAFATPLRSGAEACAEEVASALSSEYECTIITAKMRKSLPRHDTYKGVPVIRVGLGCRFDHWLYPFLAPIASRKIHPNIIHGVLETFAGLALYFCKFSCPRAKRVLTMQTTNRKFLKKFIIKSPDVLTAISTPLVEFAKKNGRGDVIHISNGIPLNLIPNIEKVSGRIVFVGRIEKMKGIDTLINAISIVSKSLPDRGISCHIVGGGSQSKSLEELSESLELSDIVKFVGFKKLPDVYTEFAEAEIFCGLSRSEALGNVFLEAQAAG